MTTFLVFFSLLHRLVLALVAMYIKIQVPRVSFLSSIAMISLVMVTPIIRMEIEFHPIYNPTEEEQTNPELFASNVRDVMSG